MCKMASNEITDAVFPPSSLALTYLSLITSIKDKKIGGEVELNTLMIQCDDISTNLHHFLINGCVIRRKNNYVVSFACPTCKRKNVVALNNLTSKIQRNISTCSTCATVNQNYNKNLEISFQNTESSYVGNTTDLWRKIQQDERAFRDQSEEFKAQYMRKHMNQESFQRIKASILSYQHGKFRNVTDVMYIPYFRNSPSPKCFEPMFYDVKRDTVEKPVCVQLECNFCGYQFMERGIMQFRNKHHVLCNRCITEFSPCKAKKELNVHGDSVSYRTKLQHKLLKYCLLNNLLIASGPKDIMFVHTDGTHRTTTIHYSLPSVSVYVDVVGNLEFQGVDSPRVVRLKEFARECNFQYVQLHPKNYVKMTRQWLKQDLKDQASERKCLLETSHVPHDQSTSSTTGSVSFVAPVVEAP